MTPEPTEPTTGSTDLAGAFAPLRHVNFRRFWLASTVNLVGSTMSSVALAFAVLSVSSSPSALGIVLAANSIPLVVFLLVGGVLADRMSRVLLLRLGSLILGLSQGAAALLVISGHAQLWMLVVLEAVNGTTQALVFPALQGLVPQLVPRGLLQQANVLQSMARGALKVLGPTVAALLVVGVGAGWALGVDAATWLISGAMLVRVRLPPQPGPEPGSEPGSGPGSRAGSGAGASTSTASQLREGWSMFTSTSWLWIVVVSFGVLNAIHAGAWFTLGPAYARTTVGERGWGLMLSAESVGLLALTVVMLRRRLERPLLLGMVGVGFIGLPILVLGLTDQLPILLAVTFLAGAGSELFGLGWTLALQEHIEERMLSRAYSYDALGSFVAIPVGQLTFGGLGAVLGIRRVLVASGLVYIVICALTLLSASVRGLRRVPITMTTPAPPVTAHPQSGVRDT